MQPTRLVLVSVLLLGGCGEEPPATPPLPDGGGATPDTGPGAAFFEPVSKEVLLFGFTGRINPQDAKSEELTTGQGTFTVRLGGVEHELTREASAKAYVAPASGSDPALAGKRFVYLTVYQQPETAAKGDRRGLSIGLPVDALAATGKPSKPPARLSVVYMTYAGKQRKDKVKLYRYCYLAVRDPAVAASRLQVRATAGFKDGAPLSVWGNIALSSAPAALLKASPVLVKDKQTGLHCRYYKGSQPVTQEQYYAGLEVEVELDCQPPAALTKPLPGGGAQLRYLFSGKVNPASKISAPGLGTFTAQLGGKTYIEDSTMQYAVLTSHGFLAGASKPAVGMVGIGEVTQVATDHVRYRMVTTYLSVQALAALDTSKGGVDLPCTAGQCLIAVTENEQLTKDGVKYSRTCPVALDDKAGAGSSGGSGSGSAGGVFACRAGSAEGEALQLAVNLPLVDDATKVQSALGLTGPCYCLMGTNNQLIPCSQFPGSK
jgi:hypothetical protein